MKNTSFLTYMKCALNSECNANEDQKNEIQKEEIKNEDLQQSIKLHFHLFDIDEVFAN